MYVIMQLSYEVDFVTDRSYTVSEFVLKAFSICTIFCLWWRFCTLHRSVFCTDYQDLLSSRDFLTDTFSLKLVDPNAAQRYRSPSLDIKVLKY